MTSAPMIPSSGFPSAEPAPAAAGPVVHLAALDLVEHAHGASFAARMAQLADPAAGMPALMHLGARYLVVPPGKKAWPFHAHHANDELFVILAGSGTLRYGAQTFAVAAGDVVLCPAGGPEGAHQLIAGDQALAYLAVSSMREPEVMEYPDSGKLTIFAGAAPGGDKAARKVALSVRAASAVDYWDGEG